MTFPINGSEHLECLIVSVGRARELNICLKNNLRHFDSAMVLTTEQDKETQRVADLHGASQLVTDAFYHGGNNLDVGLPYSIAMSRLRWGEWVLIICADIILHGNFSWYLSRLHLDRDMIYGCDRINLNRLEDIEKMVTDSLDGPASTTEWGFGYFQLFHLGSKHLKGRDPIYPSNRDHTLSDFFFRRQFGDRNHQSKDGRWYWDENAQRKLTLPCYHLGFGGVVYDAADRLRPTFAHSA